MSSSAQRASRWKLRVLNSHPAYLGAGVRVRNRGTTPLSFAVEMKLRWWNRNYFGTHFGGSLYALAAAPFRSGTTSTWANVDARAHELALNWPSLLSGQLCSRVRWREEIAAMATAGVRTFVELGPGTVLSKMIPRITDRATVHSVSDMAGVHQFLEAIG